ncbi:diguanylate cyclase [Ruminococcaceae bacterium OttesenSCG-928-O06]|nr:diguanylate cyclase [Ruminococcaceae bacterium OttesenSCG-928-O06]
MPARCCPGGNLRESNGPAPMIVPQIWKVFALITDAVMITIYAALAALVVATTVSFAMNRLHQKLSNTYYWVSACVIGWLTSNIAYHLVKDVRLVEYADILAFPFIAFLPVALLRFTLRFYHKEGFTHKSIYLLLCLIPIITTVISVVPALNGLLISGYTVVQVYPLHISDYTWSVWFYVHAGYSYLLIAACCAVVVWQYKKHPREYRTPSVLLIAGIGIAYLSNLPSFNIPDEIIDTTVVGVCLSVVALYFAVVNNPAVAFLATARKALYNNMDLPVLIMNQQEYILDMNRTACEMMEALGVRPEEVHSMVLEDVASAISSVGGTVKKGFAKDGMPHIFLRLNGENVVLKPIRRELVDKRGKPLGSYVVMIDITGLRQTVDELQWKAEVDVLTGIPNRRAFEQKVAELDVPDNLPISLIVGDVNRLKQVNDELGHKQGDMLLKTVAGVLMAACPQDGIAARVGGDEFIMALPHCDGEEAQTIVSGIHIELKRVEAQFMGASIALGSVTKKQPEEDVTVLIHEADRLMYSQKRYDRRSRTAQNEDEPAF